jgi:hypothetical protein
VFEPHRSLCPSRVVLNLFRQELEDIAHAVLGHLLLRLLEALKLVEQDAIDLPQIVSSAYEPLPLLVQPLLRLADIASQYLDCFLNTPNAYHLPTTTGLSPAACPFSSKAYPAVCPDEFQMGSVPSDLGAVILVATEEIGRGWRWARRRGLCV